MLLSNFLGFARECYDTVNRKIKKMSIPISLTKEQLKDFIHERFPKLLSNFFLFIIDLASRYIKIDIETPSDIKALKYQGSLVVCNDDLSCISAALDQAPNPTSHIRVPYPAGISRLRPPAPVSVSTPVLTSRFTVSTPSVSASRLRSPAPVSVSTAVLTSRFTVSTPSVSASTLVPVSTYSVFSPVPASNLVPASRHSVFASVSASTLVPASRHSVFASVPASTLVPRSRHSIFPSVSASPLVPASTSTVSTSSVPTSVPALVSTSVPSSVSTSVPSSVSPSVPSSVPASRFSTSNSSSNGHSLPFPFNVDDRPMSPILILPDLPPVSPPSETDDFDSFSIESELLEQRLKAINYAEIIIHRDSLFNDTINQFKSFGLTRIYVKFDGEPGDDFEGLTRELISEFWKEFCKKLSGSEKLLSLNPTAMSYPTEEDLQSVTKRYGQKCNFYFFNPHSPYINVSVTKLCCACFVFINIDTGGKGEVNLSEYMLVIRLWPLILSLIVPVFWKGKGDCLFFHLFIFFIFYLMFIININILLFNDNELFLSFFLAI